MWFAQTAQPYPLVPLWGAIIAAAVALIGSLISLVNTRLTAKAQRESARELASVNDQLEKQRIALQRSISIESEELKAMRDYEYRARQRLYDECAGLMFNLREASEGPYRRTRSLARTAREGHLPAWLSGGYYVESTIYRLLAPLAVHRIIQRKLTDVDLTLDPEIAGAHRIMREVFEVWHSDFDISRVPPRIEYDPHGLADTPLQGLFIAKLDNAIDSMVMASERRCVTFGEFEKRSNTDGEFKTALTPVFDLFRGFHPATHPVLWRLLIAQALLHSFLLDRPSEITIDAFRKSVHPDFSKSVDWRSASSSASDEYLIAEHHAAQIFIEEALTRATPWLMSKVRPG